MFWKILLYNYLEREYGILVTRAKETFEPVLIRNYESKYLEAFFHAQALLEESPR